MSIRYLVVWQNSAQPPGRGIARRRIRWRYTGRNRLARGPERCIIQHRQILVDCPDRQVRGQTLFAAVEVLAGWACRSCVTGRSEEHTSELQSLMRISYAVFCLKKQKRIKYTSPKLKCTTKIQNLTSKIHTTMKLQIKRESINT